MSTGNKALQLPGGGPYVYARRPTREVRVGDVGIGGDNPIRVQSMTTTRTLDTEATVAQTVRLVEVGCEIVRITAPSVEDAANLREIRARLRAMGVRVPLVADIHFNPRAALEAAKWVEKVRINPGNYADSRTFARHEYTDEEYARELERIEERLLPLVRHCREHGVAMRIGTNHGSLSDRIMSRFGDTPEGMVESALEFVRICERHGYRELVLSMKASNPKVMVQAYRLLAARMAAEGMDYPFHLGVTEAGSGVEARVKSAAGIGCLLDDGIGDTIRVSLAEEPEAEVPVARRLADLCTGPGAASRLAPVRVAPQDAPPEARDPFAFRRRPSRPVRFGWVTVGGSVVPRVSASVVVADVPGGVTELEILDSLFAVTSAPRTWPDLLVVGLGVDDPSPDAAERGLARLRSTLAERGRAVPLVVVSEPCQAPALLAISARSADGLKVRVPPDDPHRADPARITRDVADGLVPSARGPSRADGTSPSATGSSATGSATASSQESTGLAWWEQLRQHVRRVAEPARDRGLPVWLEVSLSATESEPVLDLTVGRALALAAEAEAAGLSDLVVGLRGADPSQVIRAARLLAAELAARGLDYPLALSVAPRSEALLPLAATESLPLDVPIALGSLLVDGLGDLVQVEPWSDNPNEAAGVRLAFDCLQAAGARTFRAELIACPSCGRTLFDLQTTTERIKAKTGHLVGVKIAVMGCVVNGPGELADADFGYMGGAPGRVNLYVGRECVEKNVPTAEADERLIALIKARGRWVEPNGPGEEPPVNADGRG